eukprot:1159858-Pelagomonas_calceolata.AAC.8
MASGWQDVYLCLGENPAGNNWLRDQVSTFPGNLEALHNQAVRAAYIHGDKAEAEGTFAFISPQAM